MKNKKQIIIFILLLLLSFLFTMSSINISHGLDSYCTMCNGYKNTAFWFLQNGRIFSYMFYNIFGLIKLPYDLLKPLSVIFSNIILTSTILILYNQITKQIKNKSKKMFLIILLFLIYYSPLTPSILTLDESFIINLGILFLTLSSIFILKHKIKNYFISLIFAILGITCYQGLSSYLFITLIILILSNKEYKKNIKLCLYKLFQTLSIYGLSFVVNLIIIKLVSSITKTSISKIGSISIVENLKTILTIHIPKSYKYFFGYINPKYYYALIIITLSISIILIIKNKNKSSNLILLTLLILSCSFGSYIPNIFMNSNSNYIEARMALTIGIIPVIIVMYIFLTFELNKKIIYSLSIISIFILLISFKSIYQNMKIDTKRYYNDMKYISNIANTIEKYEKDNYKKVDTIYYAKDKAVAYYYNFGNATDTNIRIQAIDWALDCAISNKLNRDIDLKNISNEKYQKLFNEKDYNEFSNEQIIFDNNIVYLLVY